MAVESLAELVRFAEDTYGFRYQTHVAMFIVTDEGVIMVDPCGQGNRRTPSMIKEAIRSVTEQPVKYMVYSHSAMDHATGGAVFADTAQFVGHSKTVGKLKAANEPTTPPPEITFDDRMTVELGGKKIDLHYAKLSPEDDYLILHHPASRLVMTVDYVQPKNTPFRRLLGHPDWMVERLQWIHDNLDFDVLVSGHSAPQMTGTKQDVLEQRQYYLDLSDAIAAAQKAGAADKSEEMTASVRTALAPKYGTWRRFDEFLPLNIEGMLDWRAGVTPVR